LGPSFFFLFLTPPPPSGFPPPVFVFHVLPGISPRSPAGRVSSSLSHFWRRLFFPHYVFFRKYSGLALSVVTFFSPLFCGVANTPRIRHVSDGMGFDSHLQACFFFPPGLGCVSVLFATFTLLSLPQGSLMEEWIRGVFLPKRVPFGFPHVFRVQLSAVFFPPPGWSPLPFRSSSCSQRFERSWIS